MSCRRLQDYQMGTWDTISPRGSGHGFGGQTHFKQNSINHIKEPFDTLLICSWFYRTFSYVALPMFHFLIISRCTLVGVQSMIIIIASNSNIDLKLSFY